MAKIHLSLLGCDKNRIDAEIMAKKLVDAGHVLSEDPSKSDLVLVNTCGFIEAAKKESIDVIFDMARLKEDKKSQTSALVIAGCLAERYREKLAQLIPEADAVVGIGRNGDITDIVKKALSGQRTLSFDLPEKLPLEGSRLLSTSRHYAYLKIAEGCSNRCTYCAIPSIRGHFRSRKPQDIISEARRLAAGGAKELILVAQDTTAYGKDLSGKATLSSLLREMAQIDELWKIRVLYAYPDNITDELIDTMSGEKKIARYLDIPLQHANGEVLRHMGRAGNKETLLALVRRLREGIPGIVLRSSFIVGFPGETKARFLDLLDFQEAALIDRAGCFAYSAEEGTPAFRLRNSVPQREKEERLEIFMRRQTDILGEKQRLRQGAVLETVTEGFDGQKGLCVARTEYDAPEIDTVVYFKTKNEPEIGAMVKVRITRSDSYDLYGDEIGVEESMTGGEKPIAPCSVDDICAK